MLTQTPTEISITENIVLNAQEKEDAVRMAGDKVEEEMEMEGDGDVEENVEEEEMEGKKVRHAVEEVVALAVPIKSTTACSKPTQRRTALSALDKNQELCHPKAPASRRQSRLPIPRKSRTGSHK